MIVDWRPAAAMSRSMSAWSTAIGFGCWKKGCGVWCGDERKTTRCPWLARCPTTPAPLAGAAFDGRGQRRRRAGAMREGADRHARVYQLADYEAPNPAGRSGDEHRS